jgi:type VI protein secretion system component VasF
MRIVRRFLADLSTLIEQYKAMPDGESAHAAAWLDDIAADVSAWVAEPTSNVLRERMIGAMTQFNELTIAAGAPRISDLN